MITLSSLLRPKGRGAHRLDGGLDGRAGRVTVTTLRSRGGAFGIDDTAFGDPSLELFGAKEYLRHHPVHKTLQRW